MQLFSGINDAKASRDGNYEKPGSYIERIDQMKTGESRKGEAFLVVEKTVLHVIDDNDGQGHRAGETVSHMLMAKHDSFLGNVKAMVANILGCAAEEVTESVCDELTSEAQPLSGIIIEVNNRNIVTKKGTDFTTINYRGEVTAARLRGLMTAEALAKFFPEDPNLERMEATQREAASA